MPSVIAFFFFSYYFVYGPVPRVSGTLCAVTETHLVLSQSVCVYYAKEGMLVALEKTFHPLRSTDTYRSEGVTAPKKNVLSLLVGYLVFPECSEAP